MISYGEWIRLIDAELEERCGINTGDVGDCVNFKTMYRDHLTPMEAAEACMKEWGFYDNSLVV